MTFQILCAVVATFWLASMAACLLVFRWTLLGLPRRFFPAIPLSLAALIIGILGMTRFHLAASKTVNGKIQWRFDSRWLFITTLVLGAVALACTLWKNRSLRAAGPDCSSSSPSV